MEQITTFFAMNTKDGRPGSNNPPFPGNPGGSDNPNNPNKWIGMCYVPMQVWENTYDDDTAFNAGTIFPSLNKPFLGGGR